MQNALIGLGAGFVAKGFLDTAREVEKLRLRFKFLFKEVSEGEKAFQGIVKFATQVPFSLQEIQRGAGNLAVVSKNAKEMNELLAITADIAVGAGLDFQSTNPLRIGSYTAANNTGVWKPVKGYISTVHVYHRALSSTEILHNYNALKGRFGL